MWHPPQQPVIRHRFLRQPYSLILLLLLLLALCIFVWLVVHPPRSVFPAIPGEDAIAFESGRDPGQQIYVMRADGMYPTRLTYNVRHATGWLWFLPLIFGDLVINTAPAQSPTGHGIIFLSNVTGDYAFYHLTLDGAKQTRLSIPAESIDAVVSPDGVRVAFRTSNGGLSMTDVDGEAIRCLTCTINGFMSEPTWSPNAQQIAFVRHVGMRDDVYTVNIDGTHLTQLTNSSPGFSDQPAWSPDGKRIAFRTVSDTGQAQIYVINIDGSRLVALTNDRSALYPAWSSDGKRIAFCSLRSGRAEIYTMNADGSEQTRLTYNGDNCRPVWVH